MKVKYKVAIKPHPWKGQSWDMTFGHFHDSDHVYNDRIFMFWVVLIGRWLHDDGDHMMMVVTHTHTKQFSLLWLHPLVLSPSLESNNQERVNSIILYPIIIIILITHYHHGLDRFATRHFGRVAQNLGSLQRDLQQSLDLERIETIVASSTRSLSIAREHFVHRCTQFIFW